MDQLSVSEFIAGLCIAGVTAVIPAFLAWRNAKSAKQQATAVNHAVNNREPGEPTIYELMLSSIGKLEAHDRRLQGVCQDVRALRQDVSKIDGRLGVVEDYQETH
jgi:hypothetical protein